MPIRHQKVSIKADGPDPDKIQPSDWNAEHNVADYFIDAETPTGPVNGENQDFSLIYLPENPESVKVHVNGLLQRDPEDYSISGSTIIFVEPPVSGDYIQVDYRS